MLIRIDILTKEIANTKIELPFKRYSYIGAYPDQALKVNAAKKCVPSSKNSESKFRLKHITEKSKASLMPLIFKYMDIIDLMKISNISKSIHNKYHQQIKKQMRTLLIHGLSTKERIVYWRKAIKLYKTKQMFPNYYKRVLVRLTDDKERISYDISRTFPYLEYFAHGQEGFKKMLNVLMALSDDNKKIGYNQGMNFIAALILITHGNEEDTFWLVRYIMCSPLYNYQEIFTERMTKLKILFYQLYKLIQKYLPKLYLLLNKHQIIAECFCTSWFITFFINELELETSVKAFDLFLLDGWKQIFKIALSLLSEIRNTDLDYEGLLRTLKTLTKHVPLDDARLFKKANTFKVTSSMLMTLQNQYFSGIRSVESSNMFNNTQYLRNSIIGSHGKTPKCISTFLNNSSTPKLKPHAPITHFPS